MALYLITGATGLIGRQLVSTLLKGGHEVRVLTRKAAEPWEGVQLWTWDPSTGTIPNAAIANVDHIVHLAGASIAKRWTATYKKELAASRVESATTLRDALYKTGHRPKTIVSTSGINFYRDSADAVHTEESPNGTDFLAQLCNEWEYFTGSFAHYTAQNIILRTGAVLANQGGVVPHISPLIKNWTGAVMGSGKEWFSWIHLDDMVNLIIHCSESKLEGGVYNAVSPTPVSQRDFMEELAKSLNRRILLPTLPGWILKLAIGEQSKLVLGSYKVSAKKIQATGFAFNHNSLDSALKDLALKW